MKKIYIILITLSLIIGAFLLLGDKEKLIEYNNLKLAVTVDGNTSDSLPSGNYFLVNYSCNNSDTKLIWDRSNGSINTLVNGLTDTCDLEFKSVPKLNELVSIGDYIEYTGNNGCSGTSCQGHNANQDSDTTNYTYGYCSSSGAKFYTYGWRVAYIKNNSVYIVAAGSPECVTGMNDSTTTIESLETVSLKYCNSNYLQGGVCNDNTAHPLRGGDFYNLTKGLFGDSSARGLYTYTDSSYEVSITRTCFFEYSIKECGYNNDLIDNGGHYWFGSAFAEMGMLIWDPSSRYVTHRSNSIAFGVRPVLKLDSTITATGGSGTMEDPYTISQRSGT